MEHTERLARRVRLDARLRKLLAGPGVEQRQVKAWCRRAAKWLREDAALHTTDGSLSWFRASREARLLLQLAYLASAEMRAPFSVRDRMHDLLYARLPSPSVTAFEAKRGLECLAAWCGTPA